MSLLKPYSGALGIAQRVLDTALICAALYASTIAFDLGRSPLIAGAGVAAVVVFAILAELTGLYGSWRLRSMDEEFKSAMLIWFGTCAALLVAAFLFKVSATYSRLATLMWFLITPLFLIYSRLAVRLLLRWLRKSGSNTRAVAIAGVSPVAEAIVRHLGDSASFGIKLQGIYDDRRSAREGEAETPLPRAGSLQEMVEAARRGSLDYVFIALPMRAEKRIVELTNQLADTTASVYVIPDLFIFDLMRARWTMLGTLPMVSVYESPFDGLNGALKRAEDLVLGSFLLGLAALPMLAIAIAVKVTSKGSVFFKQKRYGLNGRLVEVLKFRTMTSSDDGADVPQARRGDDRVTRLGRFLRSTSLDELPQLFNVLAGQMSLVGPRPHAVAHNEQYRRLVHGYMLRHKIKPGITGWAQVNGWRGETDTVEKMRHRVEHDLEYLSNWSVWLDLKILGATIGAVFSRKNAY